MKVDIETILELQEKLNEINSVPLDNIEFFENGELIEIDKDKIERWEYVGLNNTAFITMGFYREETSNGIPFKKN